VSPVPLFRVTVEPLEETCLTRGRAAGPAPLGTRRRRARLGVFHRRGTQRGVAARRVERHQIAAAAGGAAQLHAHRATSRVYARVLRSPSTACSDQRLMTQRPIVLSNNPYRSAGGFIPISMSTNVPPWASVKSQC
jgi:hypothetical protein